MSGRTWVTADPHFGHAGVCKFLREDGSKLRPWDDPDEMDNELVKRWNEVVEDGDRVYLLGDVVINRKALSTLYRLKGRKCLIKGNHDIFRLEEYTPHFDDIRAYVVGKYGDDQRYLLSHIPVHPRQLIRHGVNIHGHLHSNVVKNEKGEPDPRYICVSVEHTDFRPVLLQEVLKTIEVSDPR